jgi:hypothetical protein
MATVTYIASSEGLGTSFSGTLNLPKEFSSAVALVALTATSVDNNGSCNVFHKDYSANGIPVSLTGQLIAFWPWSRRVPLHLSLCILLFLVACTANAPKIVLSERGVSNSGTSGPSTINLFSQHYQILYYKFMGIVPPTSVSSDTSQGGSVTPVLLTAEGASLAYQLCSSFFKKAGTEQQYLLFSRDVIGVIGTLATGILGATHASPEATAWVGIGSGAALSGISIYTRNFLFSEDNVQAVQDLTLKAMTAQGKREC